MNEKERIDEFLKAFKELENEIVALACISDDGHVSFSKALNVVYKSRKHPLLCEYDNYDFLKSASDLRNILSHENNMCVPSEDFLNKFIKLKDAIIHPTRCFDICTKNIVSCSLDDDLTNVVSIMYASRLSHIPVLDYDGCVVGIFSRPTLFDYFAINHKNPLLLKKIKDFENILPIEKHSNERFLFVSKNEYVDKIYPLMFKSKEHDKNVSLLLVTKNGKSTEPLIGIISFTDLAKYQS